MSNLRVGDLVHDPQSGSYLACGSGCYANAVLMSIEPLILVSQETDMRWNMKSIERLKTCGKTSWWIYLRCFRRLDWRERTSSLRQRRGN